MNHVQTIIDFGTSGTIVQIECQLSNSLPSIVIVGLGNKAVEEAKERVRSAFASTGIELPRKRITINLAPADLPKDGTYLDLAIALAIMQTSEQTPICPTSRQAFIGELGLDGAVRPIRGIIGKLVACKNLGITEFFIPKGNAEQATLVPDICFTPIASIRELFGRPGASVPSKKYKSNPSLMSIKDDETGSLLSAIVGQAHAKRGLEIAAAGGHNLLLSGPPGTGKSMLAKALPSLLPPLSHTEMLEVTHLQSLASNNYDKLVTTRPFRAPHHSSSYISIVGGGSEIKPGEISLSHQGVLFLDEMPEFNRSTLEALRQPLEDSQVTLSRARHTVTYPANFILVGTANPCPCGYYGTSRPCQCAPRQIIYYQQKISGPILDRIDLHITVDMIEHDKLLKPSSDMNEESAMRNRINQARALQKQRYAGKDFLNAQMTNEDLKKQANLQPDALTLLNQAAQRLDISARSYMRLIKIARTIADLEGNKYVEIAHISEALQYRPSSHTTSN